MTRTAEFALAAALTLLSMPALAAECQSLTAEGNGYAVCEAHRGDDLRLFLDNAEGQRLGTFDRVEEKVAAEGKTLAFAMNAGMYHPDRSPVGYYVEDAEEKSRLVRSAGPGNFGLLPNGIFCILDDGFSVQETLAFDAARPACRFATQSGPMLVISGALHPRFLTESDSRFIRNGVGVSADGQTAYFLMSDGPVTFHEFASVFRDVLNVPDALYFDGNISRLYAPSLRRDDFGFPMGPIVGLVVPADSGGN
ncbi:phosphodiester glycosidase family protein [Albidovulum sediminis]|uniref:phosphodiester glycosidase family protein n=1 Tax=Albidovulum sediminis TaxID=3066345 RepID=UPI003F71909C